MDLAEMNHSRQLQMVATFDRTWESEAPAELFGALQGRRPLVFACESSET